MLEMPTEAKAMRLCGKCRILAYVWWWWLGRGGVVGLLSQSVKISTVPVMNATGEHPSAPHCDSSSYHSTGAELYFWEIGHLHRGTTSKRPCTHILVESHGFASPIKSKSSSFCNRWQRLLKADGPQRQEMKIFHVL